MAEGGVSGLMLLAGAFVFGLATGWLVWGERRAGPGRAGARSMAAPNSAVGVQSPDTLNDIAAEIDAARALLDDSGVEVAALSDALDEVDASVKRANGRLKLLAKAMRRSGDA